MGVDLLGTREGRRTVFRSRTVSLALVGLLVWVTACASYKQIEIGEVDGYNRVRVTRTDGERETLLDPVVENGAISGREDKARKHGDPIIPLVIRLDQVDKLEAVDRNATGTAVLIVLGILGGLVLLGGISEAACDGCF